MDGHEHSLGLIELKICDVRHKEKYFVVMVEILTKNTNFGGKWYETELEPTILTHAKLFWPISIHFDQHQPIFTDINPFWPIPSHFDLFTYFNWYGQYLAQYIGDFLTSPHCCWFLLALAEYASWWPCGVEFSYLFVLWGVMLVICKVSFPFNLSIYINYISLSPKLISPFCLAKKP